jgi:D-sedoheptulose 7-phosphate isomerase
MSAKMTQSTSSFPRMRESISLSQDGARRARVVGGVQELPFVSTLITQYPQLTDLREPLEQAIDLIASAFRAGHSLYVCGNGGSAADALHLSGELLKPFMRARPLSPEMQERLRATAAEDGGVLAEGLQGALPVYPLVDNPALITAQANDANPDLIFAQQLVAYAKPGDVLLAISTSGNSRNVVYAVQTAHALGAHTIALSGRDGGRLANLCDLNLIAPADQTYQIQELHLPIYHALCAQLEALFFH